MKRYLFILLYCHSIFANEDIEFELIPSRAEELCIPCQSDEFLIGNVVSPLSGQICLQKIDLVAKGAEGVQLHRSYIAPSVPPFREVHSEIDNYMNRRKYFSALQRQMKGWTFLPQLYLECSEDGQLHIPTPDGAVYDFRGVQLSSLNGVSNCSGESPSGMYDPRNIQIHFESNKITVSFPNGITRIYEKVIRAKKLYSLSKEILSNGRVIRYLYRDDHQIKRIESLDPQEQHIYASVDLDGTEIPRTLLYESGWRKGTCGSYKSNSKATAIKETGWFPYFQLNSATSSSGQSNKYTHDLIVEEKKIHKRSCGDFEHRITLPPLLQTSSTPFYRHGISSYDSFLLKSYSDENKTFQCAYAQEGDLLRVETLSLPVGEDGAFIKLYTMEYDPPIAGRKGGVTTVYREDGIRIEYRFSKVYLPESILFYDVDGLLKKQKIYQWDINQRLKSIEWKDGAGKLLNGTSYSDYDSFGNPGTEIFYGDLSGNGSREERITQRKYSQDNRNLLLEQIESNGKRTIYQYLPKTDLPLAKFTMDNQGIVLREFWKYDNAHNLVEKTSDDSSQEDPSSVGGITQRTITRYNLRREQPFLHMPEWIEELFWDGEKELLIQKTKLTYDKWGNVSEEEVFGSNGVFVYRTTKEFDEQGNVLKEVNPLKHTATATFTPKGKPETSESFSGKLETKRQYDSQERLKKIEEKDRSTGNVHETTFEYDYFDRCTEKTDYLNASTLYEYDPISNEITRIIKFPGSLNEAISSATYDPLGRKSSETDPNQHTKLYQYNVYGSPTKITYPDNSQETFLYYANGNLLSYTDRFGVSTEYKYDIFDRVTEKKMVFEGKKIAQETFTYNTFHLKTHKDRENRETFYTYDRTGRKESETLCGRTTTYGYNPLGQLASINYSDIQIVAYERDFLNQITEEKKVDLQGTTHFKTQFGWDPDGRQISIMRYPENIPAIETFDYDGFGRLIQSTNPSGHTTKTEYQETSILTTIITDPNGIVTTKTYDPDGQLTSYKIGTSYVEEREYDPASNLIQIKEDGLKTRYSYNSLNQVSSFTRAFGTPYARTTTYTYNLQGKVATKTQSNGTTLTFSYTPLGFLSSVDSSDHSLHQMFGYNLNGVLISATDGIHTLTRELDNFGNPLTETVDALSYTRTFDALDRLSTLTLPNQTTVTYTYDPIYLKTVSYAISLHTYEKYDLAGNPLSEQLFNQMGTLSHGWNLDGTQKSLNSPHFSQDLHYDPGARIDFISTDGSYTYNELSQLTSETSPNNHLTYRYDRHNNRLEKNDSFLSLNLLDEPLSHPFDRNGNLEQHGVFRLKYDPLNRLIEAKDNATTIQFVYDALDRCIARTVDGQTERYLYLDNTELGSFDSNNSIKELKIPGLYHRPIAIQLESNLFTPICDYRGNVRKLISTNTTQSYDYTAFGEELTPAATPFNPWRYSAKRLDPLLNLYYFGKRFYDPSLGRWITLDPAGFIDGTNLYAYLQNNPLSLFDPDGTMAVHILGWAFGASAFCPLTWGVMAAVGITYAACWGVQHMIDNRTLQAGTLSSTIATGLAGTLATTIVDQTSSRPWAISQSQVHSYSLSGDQVEFHYMRKSREDAKHTPDQEALSDLVKGTGKRGVSSSDADTLLDWAKECNFPCRDDRGKPPHWVGGEHIHLGPKHVRVYD